MITANIKPKAAPMDYRLHLTVIAGEEKDIGEASGVVKDETHPELRILLWKYLSTPC